MLEFLKNENDYITYLLEAFEVPETVEGKLKTKSSMFPRLILIGFILKTIPMTMTITCWRLQRRSKS